MQTQSDPRMPFVIGIVVLGVVLLGGIVWAVTSAPSAPAPISNPNVSFDDTNDPILGPSDAKVTLRIFGDFECPACRSAEQGISYIRRAYGDKVKIVWNDFPLPATMHPHAMEAARVARCAEEQGKFWEMHDLLYAEQSNWAGRSSASEDFRTYAKRLELNEEGFETCLDDRRVDEKIRAGQQEGRANGVDSTPTFFVNNTKHAGALPIERWDAILKPLIGDDATLQMSSTTSTQ